MLVVICRTCCDIDHVMYPYAFFDSSMNVLKTFFNPVSALEYAESLKDYGCRVFMVDKEI